MVGKVLNILNHMSEDRLGCYIADRFIQWDNNRSVQRANWRELRNYVYATSTQYTSNQQLPWKNKTTLPKLCQIRDNLHANYMASLFPKRKWLKWIAEDKKSNSRKKIEAIEGYMNWVVSQPQFKNEVSKLVLDYIDYGNCFATVEWQDYRVEQSDKNQVGFVGPSVRRISPLDIVFNPTASNFDQSPKITREFISLGEVKQYLERLSMDENEPAYLELWDYLKHYRQHVSTYTSDLAPLDSRYQIDGFTSFKEYLTGDYAEILTFYGDVYDYHTDQFLKNYKIMVVDRHKIVFKKPIPTFFGYPPVYHAGWRMRQDNLWAMGPLDNLVGLQYRIDHVENLKADVFDLIAFPLLKVKGYVQDFEWGPMERIYTGEEGDVEVLAPPFQVLQANSEISAYQNIMEEMAGAPKEAMGFRTPGEKTAFEVQRLENAASRIFTSKISQFEEQFLERILNGMLEMGKRLQSGDTYIRVFDDEFKMNSFRTLSPEDITGVGRIRPYAARHFAEQSEAIQNLSGIANTPIWQQISPHVSTVKTARMVEDLLNLYDYEIIEDFVQIAEQAEAQRIGSQAEENSMIERQTATGLNDDYDLEGDTQEAYQLPTSPVDQ